tara:strand:+ start:465 stop:1724 length:1260 start_codon:yes stop_codon:yes gene_type:complete
MSIKSNHYIEFENKFRGERNNIINRLSSLDELIDLIIQKNRSIKLLDIGCGRGELLQKVREKIPESLGIDSDVNMVATCKDNNLNVIQGEAIDILSSLEKDSISIITIFHMIEHINNSALFQLLDQCYRVLDDSGVLIMETPSIDSLLVSTKDFYIDPTHINHIHPEGISFFLDNIGFESSKYFHINGGPLKDDSPLKITRILNGVAQDVFFVATKTKIMSRLLFTDHDKWQEKLSIAPTTLEAAIDYDLKNEQLLDQSNNNYLSIREKLDQHNLLINKHIVNLNNELILLKNQLKYIILLLEKIKYCLFPLLNFYRFIKKYLVICLKKILHFLLKSNKIRKILVSKRLLNLVKLFLRIIPGRMSKVSVIKIDNKMIKLDDIYHKSNQFNNKLSAHYENSSRSKDYRRLLRKNRHRKII